MGKLKASQIKSLPDGFHSDGNGLYLSVSGNGKYRSWVYRCKIDGVQKKRGLGSAKNISLSEARNMVLRGKSLAKSTKKMTFKEATNKVFDDVAKIKRWKQQDTKTNHLHLLQSKAFPLIGSMKIDAITPMILAEKFLPYYLSNTSRATMLFSLMRAIFARLVALGELPINPVDNMKGLLPPRSKVYTEKHHGAIPWQAVPNAVLRLTKRKSEYIPQVILTILTACRLGEILNLEWSEVDLKNKLLVIRAEHTKTNEEHRVPLTPQMEKIILSRPKGVYVFSRRYRENALSTVQLEFGKDITIHGFRSSFRDWAADNDKSWFASEKALGHSVGSQVTRAYLRTDAMEERRLLMQDWADYACSEVQEWLDQLGGSP